MVKITPQPFPDKFSVFHYSVGGGGGQRGVKPQSKGCLLPETLPVMSKSVACIGN